MDVLYLISSFPSFLFVSLSCCVVSDPPQVDLFLWILTFGKSYLNLSSSVLSQTTYGFSLRSLTFLIVQLLLYLFIILFCIFINSHFTHTFTSKYIYESSVIIFLENPSSKIATATLSDFPIACANVRRSSTSI